MIGISVGSCSIATWLDDYLWLEKCSSSELIEKISMYFSCFSNLISIIHMLTLNGCHYSRELLGTNKKLTFFIIVFLYFGKFEV